MILASQSPRRIELMREAGYDIRVIPADIDETPFDDETPLTLVERLARAKAAAYAEPNELTVAADTIVTFDGKILGKPANEDEARTMLHELSGRTHQVATGVCIVRAGDVTAPHAAESLSFVDVTDVTFYELTDEQIAMLLVNVCPDKHVRNVWPRNYAIIILLLTTALRNSELRALTPADLDFKHAEIVVEHGKGDKFRAVDFPAIAQSAVKLYMASKIRSDELSDTDPLFGTYMPSKSADIGNELGWREISRSGLSDIVREHVRLVTGVDGVRTHAMRHICARVDLNGGMRLEELQAKLGHSEIQTTQIYSGRLMARRQRMSVEALLTARDEQAQENEKLLAKVQAKGRKYHAIVAS